MGTSYQEVQERVDQLYHHHMQIQYFDEEDNRHLNVSPIQRASTQYLQPQQTTSKFSPFHARTSSIGRQNSFNMARFQSAFNQKVNETNLNSSMVRDSSGADGETVTIDSDFVLNAAVKQAKRHATEEQADRLTLRVFVMKLDATLETFTCLECQTQQQRDHIALLEIRD